MSNKVSAPFSIAFKMDVSLLLRFLNIGTMPCQDLVDNIVTYSVNLRCKKTKLAEVKLLGPTIPIIKELLQIKVMGEFVFLGVGGWRGSVVYLQRSHCLRSHDG